MQPPSLNLELLPHMGCRTRKLGVITSDNLLMKGNWSAFWSQDHCVIIEQKPSSKLRNSNLPTFP